MFRRFLTLSLLNFLCTVGWSDRGNVKSDFITILYRGQQLKAFWRIKQDYWLGRLLYCVCVREKERYERGPILECHIRAGYEFIHWSLFQNRDQWKAKWIGWRALYLAVIQSPFSSVFITFLKIHQIFSFASHWSKRVTRLNMPQRGELENIRVISAF